HLLFVCLLLRLPSPPTSTLSPTRRSSDLLPLQGSGLLTLGVADDAVAHLPGEVQALALLLQAVHHPQGLLIMGETAGHDVVEQRSEEYTSELQSRFYLVCRLLLEKDNFSH